MTKIRFLDNARGGLAEEREVEAGTTIDSFLQNEVLDAYEGSEIESQGENLSISNYMIRVNRNPAVSGYVLNDGDYVTVTPRKISGA